LVKLGGLRKNSFEEIRSAKNGREMVEVVSFRIDYIVPGVEKGFIKALFGVFGCGIITIHCYRK